MLAIMPMITMTASISISEKPRWLEHTWDVIFCLQVVQQTGPCVGVQVFVRWFRVPLPQKECRLYPPRNDEVKRSVTLAGARFATECSVKCQLIQGLALAQVAVNRCRTMHVQIPRASSTEYYLTCALANAS